MFQIPSLLFFCHVFRSSSSSGSRECSHRKKCKHGSKGGFEGRDRESEKRCTAKDKRHARSISKSPSRSRLGSKERRKDKPRPQQSASTSRHKGELKSKPNRRLRSRSRSRERRKEEGSSKSSQKTSGFCVPSSKDVKQVQAKKKEDITFNFLKEDKGTAVKKLEAQRDSQAPTSATAKERLLMKEIKKEKPTFDMFEESAGTKPVKEEESHVCVDMAVKNVYMGFKTEACEISIIKSEASSPDFCPSVTSASPLIKPGGLQDPLDQLQAALLSPAAQPNAAELTAAVKQEIQQPSDSDDDFNIDVMLDSLQDEKPESTEDTSSDQQGKEGAIEGGSIANSGGTKSKNQVKRVTWNIQEPERPQPEKSPSSTCCQLYREFSFLFVVFLRLSSRFCFFF